MLRFFPVNRYIYTCTRYDGLIFYMYKYRCSICSICSTPIYKYIYVTDIYIFIYKTMVLQKIKRLLQKCIKLLKVKLKIHA